MTGKIQPPLCIPSEADDCEAFNAAVYAPGASTVLWPRPWGYLERVDAVIAARIRESAAEMMNPEQVEWLRVHEAAKAAERGVA